MRQRIEHVVGIIPDNYGDVLMARRDKDGQPSWELPGGKVEPGETHQQALARELREELGAKAIVGQMLGSIKHRKGSKYYETVVHIATLESQPTIQDAEPYAELDYRPFGNIALRKARRDQSKLVKKVSRVFAGRDVQL